jgi:hypothetical protein
MRENPILPTPEGEGPAFGLREAVTQGLTPDARAKTDVATGNR